MKEIKNEFNFNIFLEQYTIIIIIIVGTQKDFLHYQLLV